jgi:hypothetical protein
MHDGWSGKRREATIDVNAVPGFLFVARGAIVCGACRPEAAPRYALHKAGPLPDGGGPEH